MVGVDTEVQPDFGVAPAGGDLDRTLGQVQLLQERRAGEKGIGIELDAHLG